MRNSFSEGAKKPSYAKRKPHSSFSSSGGSRFKKDAGSSPRRSFSSFQRGGSAGGSGPRRQFGSEESRGSFTSKEASPRRYSSNSEGSRPSYGATSERRPYASSRPYSSGPKGPSSFARRSEGGFRPSTFRSDDRRPSRDRGGDDRRPAADRGEERHSGFSRNSGFRRNDRAPQRGPRKEYRGFGKSFDLAKIIKESEVEVVEKKVIPAKNFSDLGLNKIIEEALNKLDFKYPTPIQEESIPVILEGRDLVGIANTGTGKTAAFLLPILSNMTLADDGDKVLVVTPTRELAIQIEKEIARFSPVFARKTTLIIGGTSIGFQIKSLKRGWNIVVGTPGRLKDVYERRMLDLSNCGVVVLDEADRMLDMGFRDDITFLVGKVKADRQTLLFSATWDPSIEGFASSLLKNPARISVKKQEIPGHIKQEIKHVGTRDEKVELLHSILIQETVVRTLVFVNTKRMADMVSYELENRGFSVATLHGDKTQSKRERALKSFRTGQIQILVATDVAARGIDVPDVSHVINFDVPLSYDEYVHRIGRTGRAGATGHAITFMSERGGGSPRSGGSRSGGFSRGGRGGAPRTGSRDSSRSRTPRRRV